MKQVKGLKHKVSPKEWEFQRHKHEIGQIFNLWVLWRDFPSYVQVGYDMTRMAARKCFEAAGLKPKDVDVVELHDCFSANELITYEALGLCPEGETAAVQERQHSL